MSSESKANTNMTDETVKLISLTSPVIDGVKDAEEIIVYCARVSNPENQMNMETSSRLIKFLIENKHWSPFEMSNMCVEIKTSRSIAPQILRHRSFSFQEFSQRYSKVQGFVDYVPRRQAEKNRQDSVADLSDDITKWFKESKEGLEDRANEIYNEALNKGIAKECARFLLPGSCETTMYMSGSIRSWIHYLSIRTDVHTQREHREIALQIQKIFVEHFPNIAKALNWHDKKEGE